MILVKIPERNEVRAFSSSNWKYSLYLYLNNLSLNNISSKYRNGDGRCWDEKWKTFLKNKIADKYETINIGASGKFINDIGMNIWDITYNWKITEELKE